MPPNYIVDVFACVIAYMRVDASRPKHTLSQDVYAVAVAAVDDVVAAEVAAVVVVVEAVVCAVGVVDGCGRVGVAVLLLMLLRMPLML